MTDIELARFIIRKDEFFKQGYDTPIKQKVYEELLTGASVESIIADTGLPKSTIYSHVTKFNKYTGEHRVRNSVAKIKLKHLGLIR